MQKSTLLHGLEQEIRRHDFRYFVDRLPSITQYFATCPKSHTNFTPSLLFIYPLQRYSTKLRAEVLKTAMTRRRQQSFQPAAFLAKMSARSFIALFREGQTICSQGDAGKEVFYIEKGHVKLTVKSKRGKQTVLAIMHRGNYLGAECMTGQALRTATATALTPCTLLVIAKKEMTRALHNGHEFSDHFIGCLLGRNIRIEEDLIDQHLSSCEERLARALLLVARYDKIRKRTAVIPKITQGTLGGLIGSTRSRVCYFMNKFKKLGYIEYGDRLRVHNSSLSGVLKDSIFSDLAASRPN